MLAVTNMRAVIESFGIPYNTLAGILSTFDGCIAGSSALYGYLSQTETLSWTPNDLDVWIKITGLTREKCRVDKTDWNEDHEVITEKLSIKRVLRTIMKRHGFQEDRVGSYNDDEFEKLQKNDKVTRMQVRELNKKRIDAYLHEVNAATEVISSILYFSKDGKKIQFILTSDISRQELLTYFDMSVCAVAWDPDNEYATSIPQALQDAKNKRADCIYRFSEELSDRQKERLKKYQDRGFKIYVPLVL